MPEIESHAQREKSDHVMQHDRRLYVIVIRLRTGKEARYGEGNEWYRQQSRKNSHANQQPLVSCLPQVRYTKFNRVNNADNSKETPKKIVIAS